MAVWMGKKNMEKSLKAPSYVAWKICVTNFSVAGGDVHNVNMYIDIKKHKDNTRGIAN